MTLARRHFTAISKELQVLRKALIKQNTSAIALYAFDNAVRGIGAQLASAAGTFSLPHFLDAVGTPQDATSGLDEAFAEMPRVYIPTAEEPRRAD